MQLFFQAAAVGHHVDVLVVHGLDQPTVLVVIADAVKDRPAVLCLLLQLDGSRWSGSQRCRWSLRRFPVRTGNLEVRTSRSGFGVQEACLRWRKCRSRWHGKRRSPSRSACPRRSSPHTCIEDAEVGRLLHVVARTQVVHSGRAAIVCNLRTL